MLRLIRVAAIVGMALALIDFCWTAVDAPRTYDLAHSKDWHSLKVRLHQALRDQYQSGLGFAVSAILYVLASQATRDRVPGLRAEPSAAADRPRA